MSGTPSVSEMVPLPAGKAPAPVIITHATDVVEHPIRRQRRAFDQRAKLHALSKA
jgi:hypothetical protein